MAELEKQYFEIRDLADKLESLRCELSRSKEHRESVGDEFYGTDALMTTIQGQLRELAEFFAIELEK